VSGFALPLPVWLAHVPTYVPPVDTTALNAPPWSPLWHPGSPVRFLPTFDWTSFGIHWSTVIGIAVLSAIYIHWMAVLRPRRGLVARNDGWRIAAFVTAQIVMFFSLNGPIHDLSDYYLFSAHMVQHLLLTLAVPPLLLAGTPGHLVSRHLPTRRRQIEVEPIDTASRLYPAIDRRSRQRDDHEVRRSGRGETHVVP